jgi:hypothetical protein
VNRKEHKAQLKALARLRRWELQLKHGDKFPKGTCPICGERPRNLRDHERIHKQGHSPGFGKSGIPFGKRRAPGSAFAGKRQR